jgi:uncharacterized protein YqhQ
MESVTTAPSRLPYIGGQAVLEGVMMRAPASFAVVVRRRDGSLHVRERAMDAQPRKVSRWPFVRGIASLVESLRLGNEALRFSAEKMEEDLVQAGDSGPRRAGSAPPRAGSAPRRAGDGTLGVLTALALMIMSGLGAEGEPAIAGGSGAERRGGGGQWVMLLVAIGFFVALPQAAAAGIVRLMHLDFAVQSGPFQAMTGALKLTIVVGYLLGIRRIPEIKRVFQYHGAEHKTISVYEAGEDLTVDNARAKTTLHPRCGTTFLVMVALVSIAVFSAVGAALPRIHTGSVVADNALFFLEKLPFLPVLAGITFELQRVLARYCSTGPLRTLLWPGFLVQKITTAEPDDAQLEVALASLRATLFRQTAAARSDVHAANAMATSDVVFPDYAAIAAAPALR